MAIPNLKPDMTIHCLTETEARTLLADLRDNGYRWDNGNPISPEQNYWHIHKEKTCYTLRLDILGQKCVILMRSTLCRDLITEFRTLVPSEERIVYTDAPIRIHCRNTSETERLLAFLAKHGYVWEDTTEKVDNGASGKYGSRTTYVIDPATKTVCMKLQPAEYPELMFRDTDKPAIILNRPERSEMMEFRI